jgi:release factor glutamine methyltransferase
MLTVLEIIKRTTDFFATKGIESPRLNAEVLIGHALRRKRMQLYLEFERLLTEPELETIRPLVRRRAQHEPLQYIMGETDFFGLKLKVDRRVLIPRPETEQLVQAIGDMFSGTAAPTRILELGTGSGAIALALAERFPDAAITATDISADALEVARENSLANGFAQRVSWVEADWFQGVSGAAFDLIVSNPPYLSAEEVGETRLEVHGFEPSGALIAADGGMADLATIIAGAPAFLTPTGRLALETGIAQHARLEELSREAGFSRVESKRDLTGRDRFVFAFR